MIESACMFARGADGKWKCSIYIFLLEKLNFGSLGQGIIAEDEKGIWEILELKIEFFAPTRQLYLTLLVPSSTLF